MPKHEEPSREDDLADAAAIADRRPRVREVFPVVDLRKDRQTTTNHFKDFTAVVEDADDDQMELELGEAAGGTPNPTISS